MATRPRCAHRVRLSQVLLVAALAGGAAPAWGQSDLSQGFAHPPTVSRPHTWWHWMNGNVTKEGITADLEAMKQIGLGGAQIFNVSESIPEGPVNIMSPQWREMVKHAAAEANRLGIELCMHNCSGWSSSGGPWIKPEFAMQEVVFSETHAKGGAPIETALPQPKSKQNYYRDIAVLAFPTPADDSKRIPDIGPKAGYDGRYGQKPALTAYPANAVIKLDSVVDITSKMDKDGKLSWTPPAGDWTILRFGHSCTGAVNAPSPNSGRGLEVDKLSREAFDTHWAGMMGPVIKDLGPLAGKTLNNCLIDSYEVGHQNWTPKFREEFKKRRGYDLLMYLPAITGRVIDSGEVSERFLWDFRRTIGDLFADNYYSYFAETCRKNGLLASIEPYDGPFECELTGRDADIPMGEFWVGSGESNSCKLAASVGHVYGQRIIGAESFTAEPGVGRWQNYPASLKGVGDLMYTVGINRYIIHRYAHQPWMNVLPGMTMGQWGTHFERTVTWWNQGGAWIDYLARCQYLLQQGRFSADVCYFTGDESPNGAPHMPGLKGAGYDYDAVNPDVLLRRLTVKNGRFTLPDGLSYAVMVLPESAFMAPATIQKLHDLVKEGGVVIGPRPERSPSLTDMQASDAKVKSLAQEMWGNCDGKAVTSHDFGKGRVYWGVTPEQALASAKVAPDCEFSSMSHAKMAWIHRVDGDADIYFVSNQKPASVDVNITIRVAGKTPELWHADTGVMEPAPLWSERDGRTTVSTRLEPTGSVFIVLRSKASGADHLASAHGPGDRSSAEAAPKVEIRKASYDAVDGAGGTDVTAKVAGMVARGESAIAATNGNFGDPAYLHVKRLKIEYTLAGKPVTRTADENATIELFDTNDADAPATYAIKATAKGAELVAFKPGTYEFKTAKGETKKVDVSAIGTPIEVKGPWKVSFPPNWGAPASITMDTLNSWTQSADAGVKYFSGTAEYQTTFTVPQELVSSQTPVWLDLGRVCQFAEVSINGQALGVWWKAPFSGDVTSLVKAGSNTLSVKITNLWVNRLIGDEQEPADMEWNGKPIKAWPKWFVDHTPRPSKGRYTFTTWHHYEKNSPLMESGLIGPVVVRPGARVAVP